MRLLATEGMEGMGIRGSRGLHGVGIRMGIRVGHMHMHTGGGGVEEGVIGRVGGRRIAW